MGDTHTTQSAHGIRHGAPRVSQVIPPSPADPLALHAASAGRRVVHTPYSLRSATIGSARVARRAGSRQASAAKPPSSRAAAA